MRRFLSGRVLPSLILWAALATGGIVLLWGREPRLLSGSLVALLTLFGPLAAALHALRCRFQNVSVDEHGLILPGGRTVPWSSVRAVHLRPAPFQKILDGDLPEDMPHEATWPLLGAKTLWAILYCVFLPAFAIFTPWHGRVTLTLADGTTLVYRDLEEPEAFVSLLRIGMSGRKDRAEKLRRACA